MAIVDPQAGEDGTEEGEQPHDKEDDGRAVVVDRHRVGHGEAVRSDCAGQEGGQGESGDEYDPENRFGKREQRVRRSSSNWWRSRSNPIVHATPPRSRRRTSAPPTSTRAGTRAMRSRPAPTRKLAMPSSRRRLRRGRSRDAVTAPSAGRRRPQRTARRRPRLRRPGHRVDPGYPHERSTGSHGGGQAEEEARRQPAAGGCRPGGSGSHPVRVPVPTYRRGGRPYADRGDGGEQERRGRDVQSKTDRVVAEERDAGPKRPSEQRDQAKTPAAGAMT